MQMSHHADTVALLLVIVATRMEVATTRKREAACRLRGVVPHGLMLKVKNTMKLTNDTSVLHPEVAGKSLEMVFIQLKVKDMRHEEEANHPVRVKQTEVEGSSQVTVVMPLVEGKHLVEGKPLVEGKSLVEEVAMPPVEAEEVAMLPVEPLVEGEAVDMLQVEVQALLMPQYPKVGFQEGDTKEACFKKHSMLLPGSTEYMCLFQQAFPL